MTVTTDAIAPEWLKLRDGSLQPGVRADTRFVMIAGQPQYRLDLRPAAGKFGCAVLNTVNGKRIDTGSATYETAEAALAGGLDQLREKLGW